jgi:hypothetical protein
MPNIDTHHPQPCANCGHRNLHGEVSGCTANTAELGKPAIWCPCDKYVAPRDRAKDLAEGVRLGREGADAALHSYAVNVADQDTWRTKAEAVLDDLIATGDQFTSEDVVDKVGPAPSRNAIGGLFQGRKADMEVIGFTQATRPEAHGRALRIWKARES